ncbi:MAG: hypothetical protein ACRBM6_37755, partial [Geminicoccales bacterium]
QKVALGDTLLFGFGHFHRRDPIQPLLQLGFHDAAGPGERQTVAKPWGEIMFTIWQGEFLVTKV